MIPHVLSIAGVDPSGGAGLLADLKTFSALQAYGMGVVAALTAQSTLGVAGVQAVPAEFVAQQIDTLFADVRIDSVKLGMLGTADVVAAVADALRRHRPAHCVLDSVMVSTSGRALLTPDAVAVLRRELLPLVEIVTPNLPEAGVLLGAPEPRSLAEMRVAARALCALGPRYVLLKGGHLDGAESVDLFDDGQTQVELAAPRLATRNVHGTGCALSSAIAALLPRHAQPLDAVREAKRWLTAAIAGADRLDVGHGPGPVNPFHALWPTD
ncbi:MAG TPA: bifunctional hydroxymethylpyrimidine kinase/phosphomethylpyrimidine kinase [Opitutaceae bacterium]|nr:bifunctional hydroxymethylpyrimidine kinase/phosphomethylpyrimidine kinase [Opitutaceae bacterium]